MMNTFITISLFVTGVAFAQTTDDDRQEPTLTCSVAEATNIFRENNGGCNNIDNAGFGAAESPFARFIPAIYSGDGTMPSLAVSGKPLPNARLVSSTIHTDMDVPDVWSTNAFVMFGQFLDHDITETPFSPGGTAATPEIAMCCDETIAMETPECIPITPIVHDPFFSKLRFPQTCLPLTRSVDCFSSTTCSFIAGARLDTSGFEAREQENAISAYVDSSNIYGMDEDNANNLRTFSGGLLRSTITATGNELLPILSDPTSDNFAEENVACEGATEEIPAKGCLFRGGDIRARENAILTTWHTLGLREHNRIARACAAVNPQLNDEELYQFARRLVTAEFANVVYGEWLPQLLGQATIQAFGIHLDFPNAYNATLDPSIRNSFATAAFRFGHSMLQGSPLLTDASGSSTTLKLRDIIDNPTTYASNDGEGAEMLMRGLFEVPSQTFDRFVTKDVTNFLFLPSETACSGEDLVARNLQRARDHGLPGYLAFRKFCGLSHEHYDWHSKPSSIPKDAWKKLKQVYESPKDIELFTGGLVETPVEGTALTGPVFNCLKAMQFQLLRGGDRFFFTHTDQVGSFNDAQIAKIKKRTLRGIICDNFPGITEARVATFVNASPFESCDLSPDVDVSLFIPAPVQAAPACPPGGNDFRCCTVNQPCGLNQGDCDNNNECQGSSICGRNNCRQIDPLANRWLDCCTTP